MVVNMNEKRKKNTISRDNRPQFPKRAVVTGGMPYGNKTLHFGHVGGVFVFADVYARFLRDRIGKDNLIYGFYIAHINGDHRFFCTLCRFEI